MEHKIRLLEAKAELEASVRMYRELLNSTEKSLRKVNTDLDADFTPANSRYSCGELASVKRRIVGVLTSAAVSSYSGVAWISPRSLFDSIEEHDDQLIMRELRKLSFNPRSDIVWNKRKGTASQYRKA